MAQRVLLLAILAVLALAVPVTASASDLGQRHGGHGITVNVTPVHGQPFGFRVPRPHLGFGFRHPLFAPGGLGFGVPFVAPAAVPVPYAVPAAFAVPVPVSVPVAVPQPVAVPAPVAVPQYAPALPVAAPPCGCAP
jgi:hypothetical protein